MAVSNQLVVECPYCKTFVRPIIERMINHPIVIGFVARCDNCSNEFIVEIKLVISKAE